MAATLTKILCRYREHRLVGFVGWSSRGTCFVDTSFKSHTDKDKGFRLGLLGAVGDLSSDHYPGRVPSPIPVVIDNSLGASRTFLHRKVFRILKGWHRHLAFAIRHHWF